MRIGIQVSSLRPLLGTEEQVRETFRQLGARGWDTVQLQWIDPAVPPEVIAGAVAEQGMVSLGTQDLYTLVRERLEYYVNLNDLTGGKWLCVSRIPEAYKSREGLAAFARELTALQERLEPRGQRLCFHPVTADFLAVPGMDAVAWLLEALPWLPLCLDLYHLNRCRTDMPGFLCSYAGRIPMVHFKDSRGDTLVPAGQGDTDWTGVVEACVEAGVEFALVEQERWTGDPYEVLSQARDWLRDRL